MLNRLSKPLTLSLVAGAALASSALAQTVVVPNAYTAVGSATSPFDTLTREFGRSYQQVFAASELAIAPGSLITAITFRSSGAAGANPPGTWPPADLTYADYEIYLGQSAVAPGSMSTTYAANVVLGSEQQVRDGALVIPANSWSNTVALPGANPWGYTINVTPFVYPGGDLVMTVRHVGHATVGTPRHFVDVVANPTLPGTQCMANSTTTATEGTAAQSSPAIVQFTYTGGGPTGACCLGAPSYSCIVTTSGGCASAGGTYLGNGSGCGACPPPPTGACCSPFTGCSIVTQAACTASGGTYAGNNISCAAAHCPAITGWLETGDAGNLPTNAQVVTGSGSLTNIKGTLGADDADMYRINVCDAANFSASTVGGTTVDTQLFMFKLNGTGLVFNDDTPAGGVLQSALSNLFVGPNGNGELFLAISQWDKDPLGATTNGEIWADTPYAVERAPDGVAPTEAVGSWSITTTAGGPYIIATTGTCFIGGGGCYANCDGSTGTPALTANDFQCFLNLYANNDPIANCDGSTGTPALTANDFQCFLNKYAEGCS